MTWLNVMRAGELSGRCADVSYRIAPLRHCHVQGVDMGAPRAAAGT